VTGILLFAFAMGTFALAIISRIMVNPENLSLPEHDADVYQNVLFRSRL
jgi:hypothetical protein